MRKSFLVSSVLFSLFFASSASAYTLDCLNNAASGTTFSMGGRDHGDTYYANRHGYDAKADNAKMGAELQATLTNCQNELAYYQKAGATNANGIPYSGDDLNSRINWLNSAIPNIQKGVNECKQDKHQHKQGIDCTKHYDKLYPGDNLLIKVGY